MYSINIQQKDNQSNIKVARELIPGLHVYADILEWRGLKVGDLHIKNILKILGAR